MVHHHDHLTKVVIETSAYTHVISVVVVVVVVKVINLFEIGFDRHKVIDSVAAVIATTAISAVVVVDDNLAAAEAAAAAAAAVPTGRNVIQFDSG